MIAERIVRKSGLWNSSEVRNSFINENTAWLVENIRRAILALSIVFAVLLVNFTAIARFRDQKHIRCHRFSIVDQFSVNFWTLLPIRSRILRFYLLLKSCFPVCFTSKSLSKISCVFLGQLMMVHAQTYQLNLLSETEFSQSSDQSSPYRQNLSLQNLYAQGIGKSFFVLYRWALCSLE